MRAFFVTRVRIHELVGRDRDHLAYDILPCTDTVDGVIWILLFCDFRQGLLTGSSIPNAVSSMWSAKQ